MLCASTQRTCYAIVLLRLTQTAHSDFKMLFETQNATDTSVEVEGSIHLKTKRKPCIKWLTETWQLTCNDVEMKKYTALQKHSYPLNLFKLCLVLDIGG